MIKKPKKPKIRKKWTINPKTRVTKSAKKYNRKQAKRALKSIIEEVLK